MNEKDQLKVQAYLDGELSPREMEAAERFIETHADAKALLLELRLTRQALHLNEAVVMLPESREFFWSKIQREIRSQEQPEDDAQTVPLFGLWRRIFVPLGALAALLIVAVVAQRQFQSADVARFDPAESVETTLADAGAVTYRDQQEGTTLVWLSYPAENELAQSTSTDNLQ